MAGFDQAITMLDDIAAHEIEVDQAREYMRQLFGGPILPHPET